MAKNVFFKTDYLSKLDKRNLKPGCKKHSLNLPTRFQTKIFHVHLDRNPGQKEVHYFFSSRSPMIFRTSFVECSNTPISPSQPPSTIASYARWLYFFATQDNLQDPKDIPSHGTLWNGFTFTTPKNGLMIFLTTQIIQHGVFALMVFSFL